MNKKQMTMRKQKLTPVLFLPFLLVKFVFKWEKVG